jgi:rhodanese-related sulfurtransferase
MLSMLPSVLAGVNRRDLERIKDITREVYPSVSQVGTGALAEWLQQAHPSLLLVDVRSPEEFAVSHLPGAVNLQSVEQIAQAVTMKKPATTILYCSVGFRSSRLAHLLSQQGWRDITNLEGSIFQWANEGRPVYRGDIPVQRVHPYGKRWAGLLKDGLATEC